MTNVPWADLRAFRTQGREVSSSYKTGAQLSLNSPPPTFSRRGNEARKQFQKAWGGLQQGSQGHVDHRLLLLCHLWSVEGSITVFFTSTSSKYTYVREVYNFYFPTSQVSLFCLVFSESSRSLGSGRMPPLLSFSTISQ